MSVKKETPKLKALGFPFYIIPILLKNILLNYLGKLLKSIKKHSIVKAIS